MIYLPDPEFQELALAGVETLVSTRLDPGVDPIVEADRRGAILAIIRLGNKDLQVARLPTQEGGVAPASIAPLHGTAGNCGRRRPWPMGMAGGAATSGMPLGICGRRDRAAIRNADVRHADRAAWPAHVPLGVPAGLQQHIIVNHTPRVDLPAPTEKVEDRRQAEAGLVAIRSRSIMS